MELDLYFYLDREKEIKNIVALIPKKRNNHGNRMLTDEIKRRILKLWSYAKYRGEKANFARQLGMNANCISRWKRNRTNERKKMTKEKIITPAVAEEIEKFAKRKPKMQKGEDRMIWPSDLKRDAVEYYFSFKPGDPRRAELSKALKVDPSFFFQWKKTVNLSTKVSTVEPLKTKSIAAGGKIIGTTLASVLHAIPSNDIISQVEMVDILSLAGYKEDSLIEKLNTTLPTIEDWKRIKSALKMLDEIYDITITEKE